MTWDIWFLKERTMLKPNNDETRPGHGGGEDEIRPNSGGGGEVEISQNGGGSGG